MTAPQRTSTPEGYDVEVYDDSTVWISYVDGGGHPLRYPLAVYVDAMRAHLARIAVSEEVVARPVPPVVLVDEFDSTEPTQFGKATYRYRQVVQVPTGPGKSETVCVVASTTTSGETGVRYAVTVYDRDRLCWSEVLTLRWQDVPPDLGPDRKSVEEFVWVRLYDPACRILGLPQP